MACPISLRHQDHWAAQVPMGLMDYARVEHGLKLILNHIFLVLGKTIIAAVHLHLWGHLDVVFYKISVNWGVL